MRFCFSRRRLPLAFALVGSIAFSSPLRAQQPAAVPPATPAPTAPAPAPARDISWLRLPSNVLHDQRNIARFPVAVVHGRHLLPTFTVVGLTGALIATDQHDASYFRNTANFQSFNRVFSGHATSLATAIAPASFYAVGLLRKDPYEQKTALLSGEALADSLILSTVIKVSTLRLRPSDIPPQGDFSDSFFLRRHSVTSGSFPSGHTIAAFSIATIFAQRYRRHRWVPWVAYGAAATIAFSRISLQAHFPSDVFLGAALGYSVSRFVVLAR
jgi:membrane-associated phospholipid phosphatase